ncbi:ZYRO0G16390p [Zygosaccharomyces rouxii]|uniref:Ribonuclease H2 subunit B n=1 Tax=Zygosaccharomyces rouxii (strain ATCC 2623 / CBS 732 / NBRC 1130 / NCYC 568 / NRRL Y-229) TaxID=559307 RepID=C5E0X6_ZYGRC|nr:uncharacterized protein ZYRO0G16390g [Zygosaccharomyces rouxii]KAH9202753.1 ribonuclease H2, subunit B [Zygosaccharomyces rouxii]CAR29760.1 ZYRO0G16390p [Zygosaccharomyces rouxii]
MTVGSDSKRWILVLPPELLDCKENAQIFSLPHPSNNTSKDRMQLVEFKGKGIYQLKSHEFSRGCSYTDDQDQAEDNYHYTKDGKTIKSTLVINENDPQNGYVMEDGDFQYLSKTDITFNLIGFFYKEFTVQDEKDYLREDAPTTMQSDNKFLGLRDYHDLLVDSHDHEWSKVSLETFKAAMENVADPIEEAGDIYYKITTQKIMQCLIRKTRQILDAFPTTIPIPSSLPPEIMESAKVTIAVNLLISLIPRPAYWHLVKYTGEELNVAKAFQKYEDYIQNIKDVTKEKESLVQSAMNVGLTNGSNSTTKTTKKVVKKTVSQRKVATGKGSIDGFFKRAK